MGVQNERQPQTYRARPEPGHQLLAFRGKGVLGDDDGVVEDGVAEIVEQERDRLRPVLLYGERHVGGEIERGVYLALDERRRIVGVWHDVDLRAVDAVGAQHHLDRDDVDRRHGKRLADEALRVVDRVFRQRNDAVRVLLVLGADDLELGALVDDRLDRRIGRRQREVGLAGDDRAFGNKVRPARKISQVQALVPVVAVVDGGEIAGELGVVDPGRLHGQRRGGACAPGCERCRGGGGRERHEPAPVDIVPHVVPLSFLDPKVRQGP